MSLYKACPRCKRLIPQGLQYCEVCAPIVAQNRQALKEHRAECLRRKRNNRYNSKRDPKYTAFYSSKPRKMTSRKKLEDAGYKCETPEGWDLRLEWTNLEAVCTSCHNHRHPEKYKKKDEPGVIDIRKLLR